MPPKDLGAPVVDETGLSGKFDLALEWEYLPPSSGNAPAVLLHCPTLQEAWRSSSD
jgi:uncharacterized protein (TIGR03435 family)